MKRKKRDEIALGLLKMFLMKREPGSVLKKRANISIKDSFIYYFFYLISKSKRLDSILR